MNAIHKLVDLFVIADSEDISADANFRISFYNVVNLFLLVYSLTLGLYSLFAEMEHVAIMNMIFSALFLVNTLLILIINNRFYKHKVMLYVNNTLIFSYFIVAFYSGASFDFSGVVMLMYPFVAIVLHGRMMGLVLSFAQMILLIVSVIVIKSLDLAADAIKYDTDEMVIMACLQLFSMFVFYVAINWLSTMLYDKIRETMLLTDELKVKSDLVKSLITQIRPQEESINSMVQKIQIETHLTDTQKVMIAEIYNGTQGVIHTIDSIDVASNNNIQPVKFEETLFDLNALIGSLLQDYNRRPSIVERHTVTFSTEIPQRQLGNSQLTRNILSEIFRGIDQTVDMDNQPLNVNVSLGELTEEVETLIFEISLEVDLQFDMRELGSEEIILIEKFNLSNVRRIAIAYGGEFVISYEDRILIIEFTQKFKNHERLGGITDKDSVQAQRSLQKANAVVSVSKASVLIVDNNVVNQHILSSFIEGKVGNVTVVSSGKEAISKFENGRYDVVIMELQMPDMNGFETTRVIRDIESGFGGRVPIIAVASTIMYNDVRQRCYDAGMDAFLARPFLAADIMNIMIEKLKC